MIYVVLTRFADLRDENHIYEAGDTYPRPGFDVSPDRLAELAGRDNLVGKPLIGKRVECAETPVEASESVPKDLPAEPQKPAKKPTRSRKRGR